MAPCRSRFSRLLLFQNETIDPIEIKKSASSGQSTIKNFGVLSPIEQPEKLGGMQELKGEIGTGSLVCMANDLLPIDQKNWYVPVWMISATFASPITRCPAIQYIPVRRQHIFPRPSSHTTSPAHPHASAVVGSAAGCRRFASPSASRIFWRITDDLSPSDQAFNPLCYIFTSPCHW